MMANPLLHSFDRICIISLRERHDRRRAVTRELQRQGIAIDGERVRFVDAIRPDHAAGFPSIGARGCFLSHLKALRQAHADGVRNVLVLEDDVMFTSTIARAASLAATRGEAWSFAYPGHAQAALPGDLRWQRCDEPLVCAHCYAVNRQALPVVIEHLEACLCRPSGHPAGSPMHYDGALSVLRRARPDLLTLVASRSLAGQRSSRSDIEGPSWLDRLALPGLATAARALRNHWRRAASNG